MYSKPKINLCNDIEKLTPLILQDLDDDILLQILSQCKKLYKEQEFHTERSKKCE